MEFPFLNPNELPERQRENSSALRILEFPHEENPPRLERRAITPLEFALLRDVLAHADAVAADAIRRGVLPAGAALALLTEFIRGVERMDPEAAERLAPTAALQAALTKS
jgi:hypothetical protein